MVVRYYLIIGQAKLYVNKILVAVHEKRAKVA